MYTTNYSTTLTLRTNPSFPYYPLHPLVAADLAVRRLSGHFLRQSSLLYWSPSRRLASARYHWLASDAHDLESRREDSSRCCCHCRRSDDFGVIGEVRDRFGGERWAPDGFGREIARRPRYSRREVSIWSSDSEEDEVCWSCRCEIRELRGRSDGGKSSRNRGRRNGCGSGWRVSSGVRYCGEISESDDCDCRHRESRPRRVHGRCTRACDHQAKDDDYSSEEEYRRRECYDDLDRRKSSRLRNSGKESGSSSSMRKYSEVDKKVGRRGEWEGDRRVERGSSYRVSGHEAREELRRGQGSTFGGKDTREEYRKFARVSDIYEEDTGKVYGSKRYIDEVRMQGEKGTLNVHHFDKVGKKFTGQSDFKINGRQQYFCEDDEDARQWDSREGTRKFVEISEVNNDDAVMISNIKNVVDRRKVNMQGSSSSSLKQHREVDERLGISETRNSLETLKDISEIHDSNNEEVWHSNKDYSVVNLKDRKDSLTSVQKIRDAKSQYETRMETKGISSNVVQYNQGGSRLVGQDELRYEGMQQHVHGVDVDLRERNSRLHKKFVDVSEANVDESMHISNLKSNVDSRKSHIDQSSSSAFEQYMEVDVRTSSLSDSKNVKTRKETSEVYDSNTDFAWNILKQQNEGTIKVTSDQTDSVLIESHEREKDSKNSISSTRLNTELIDSNKTFKNHTDISVANASAIKVGSSSKIYKGTRVNDQEECSTSTANLVYGGEEYQSQEDKWRTQLTGPTKESGRYLQSSELLRRDAKTVSIIEEVNDKVDERQQTSKLKLGTEILTSGLPRKNSQMLSNSQVTSNTQINIVLNDHQSSRSETVTYEQASGMPGKDSNIAPTAETTSSTRMNNRLDDIEYIRRKEYGQHMQVSKLTGRDAQKVSSTQVMSSVHSNDELDDQPYGSRRESEKYLLVSELSRRDVTRADSIQTTPSLLLDTKFHQHGLERELENDHSVSSFSREDLKIDSDIQVVSSMRPEHTSSLSSVSRQDNKEKENTLVGSLQLAGRTDIGSTATYEIGSGFSDGHIQAKNEQNSFDAMVGVEVDILGSASRLDRSSAFFVGEFVEKLQQEASTSQGHSEILVNEAAKENIQIQGYLGRQVDKTQNEIISTAVNMSQPEAKIKHETGYSMRERKWRSSSLPAMKGPSDKMWRTGSLISEEELHKEARKVKSVVEAMETVTPTSARITSSDATRRSPRSLWACVADIVRLGWTSHARLGALDQPEGMKTSPHHSTGSEAWFSGQEIDDSDEETDTKGQVGTAKVSSILTQPNDQTQESIYSSLEQRISEGSELAEGAVQSEISSSTSVTTGGLVSADDPISILEGSVDTAAVTGAAMIPPILISVNKPSIMGVAASHMIGSVKTDMKDPPVPLGGFTRLEEEITEDPTKVQEATGNDGEVKRRKFQRNNQVVKESFDDWEEAYRLESEQRKIDEFFMREALAEAQKAADIWEVPVGAVLVQDGKIIARACNLVEDMRDSTAHAEMICIREASNLLRTWRLAGTTLYVTLEPCPMCAGAILQARIDAVVWGAPNKLLGADGSWVRLFPTGDGSSSSLDTSNQLAGPIHPFHPKIIIRRGILATECADVMQQFFKIRRKKEKKPESSSKESSKESSAKHSRLHLARHPVKFFSKIPNIFTIMFCL